MSIKVDCHNCGGVGYIDSERTKECKRCYDTGIRGYRVPRSDIDPPFTPITHDTRTESELSPFEDLSDDTLMARYNAAWASVFIYGEEIRRRAGESIKLV